jgi:hypothetical protein
MRNFLTTRIDWHIFTRGSKYDQICPVCNGKNVISVVAENLLNDKEKVLYAEYQKCEERIAREEAADRATLRAENGYRE